MISVDLTFRIVSLKVELANVCHINLVSPETYLKYLSCDPLTHCVILYFESESETVLYSINPC